MIRSPCEPKLSSSPFNVVERVQAAIDRATVVSQGLPSAVQPLLSRFPPVRDATAPLPKVLIASSGAVSKPLMKDLLNGHVIDKSE